MFNFGFGQKSLNKQLKKIIIEKKKEKIQNNRKSLIINYGQNISKLLKKMK
jgi:hypothetical protein